MMAKEYSLLPPPSSLKLDYLFDFVGLNYKNVKYMADWLIDWLTVWMIDWLTNWLLVK